jgi:hypothetical protein
MTRLPRLSCTIALSVKPRAISHRDDFHEHLIDLSLELKGKITKSLEITDSTKTTEHVEIERTSTFNAICSRKASEDIIDEGQRRIDALHSNFPSALCRLALAHAMSTPGDYGRQCNPAVGEE